MKIMIILLVLLAIGGTTFWWFILRNDDTPPATNSVVEEGVTVKFREELPDFPDLRLTNVFALEGYAVADWSDENIGGMVVFKLVGGEWEILVIDGGVLEESMLTERGVPADIAHRLLARQRI